MVGRQQTTGRGLAQGQIQGVMPLIESLWLQLGQVQRQLMAGGQHHYSVDRHMQILSALRARDAAGLATALSADIHEAPASKG